MTSFERLRPSKKISFAYGWEQKWFQQHYVIRDNEGVTWTARSNVELSHAEITAALRTAPSTEGARRNISFNGQQVNVKYKLYSYRNYEILLVAFV
ncbi:MAG: hypothetical protein KIH62_005180 [Candidatus Kerfeldbacteria bacterium]|nr:hypothetical protein [Candidatus Kerfeldbacteria bacterium]